MPTVVVIGGGFSGCAAAVAAARAGAEAILLDKTDMLAGLGVLSGVLDANGALTASLEAKAMGGGDLFQACESVTLHEIDHIEQLGLKHLRLFDVLKVEQAVRKVLLCAGVKISLRARVTSVKMKGNAIASVVLNNSANIEGTAFVDATGGCGTMAECSKYGYGCVMCIMRCPTFGGRVSISAKAGIKDLVGMRADGRPGALTSGFNLVRQSVGPAILAALDKDGYAVLPMPKELIRYEKLGMITATENARRSQLENLRIVDNGYAKVSVHAFMPLTELHSISGLENARIADPLSGGIGNAVRSLAMAPRDNRMKVVGLANLYCAGEKAGPKSGLPAAITSGALAGHNAARHSLRKEELILPRTTAIGDFIAFENEQMSSPEGLKQRYGFSGGLYFDRMVKLGLYSTDPKEVMARLEKAGLREIFARKV